MVLELHDPPLLVETDETGPLEPVPTMMQVLADVHAIPRVAKKLPGVANPAGPVTDVQEVPASVVITVTNGSPFVGEKPVAKQVVADPQATSRTVAVLAGSAVELDQLDPPSVEMSSSPGSVGVCRPPAFVPTVRHVVVVGRQSTESNSLFIPVYGTSDHVAPPSIVWSRPDPTAIHDEDKQVIYVPIPDGFGLVTVQVVPPSAV
jgi:hypothetical protein